MITPFITIGLTAYNAQETVERAVFSAMAQVWPKDKLEIIIVDDASDDLTSQVLKKFRNQEGIELIRLPENKGVAAARNKIIKKAKGEFIAFFDDDDVSMPLRLQKQYHTLQMYDSMAICHTDRLRLYPDGTHELEQSYQCKGDNAHLVAERLLLGMHLNRYEGSLATCSQMGSSVLYRDILFDENLRRSEDTDFCIRAALKGIDFVCVNEILVHQNITQSHDKSPSQEQYYILCMLKKHKSFIDKYKMYEFLYLWTQTKYGFANKDWLEAIQQALKLFIYFPFKTARKSIRSLLRV